MSYISIPYETNEILRILTSASTTYSCFTNKHRLIFTGPFHGFPLLSVKTEAKLQRIAQ